LARAVEEVIDVGEEVVEGVGFGGCGGGGRGFGVRGGAEGCCAGLVTQDDIGGHEVVSEDLAAA
jgi:hypothetical protein